MIGRGRALVVAGTSVAAAIWLNLGGVAAQVPAVPTPPETTAPPTTVAPPAEAPPPAPTDTLPAGTPEAPPTPADPAPAPGATTTTVPAGKLSESALPPARASGGPATGFGLDLSEIDALRRAARGKGPRAPEPDPGFDLTLGFRADAGPESSGEEAIELGAEEEEMARVRSASAVAAGLMALLLTGIARGLLRQGRPLRPGPAGD